MGRLCPLSWGDRRSFGFVQSFCRQNIKQAQGSWSDRNPGTMDGESLRRPAIIRNRPARSFFPSNVIWKEKIQLCLSRGKPISTSDRPYYVNLPELAVLVEVVDDVDVTGGDMSAFGRHWSLHVRGLSMAEHAVLYRLGDRHNETTGRCFPNRQTLARELECSRTYLTEIFASFAHKKFASIEEQTERIMIASGKIVERQTSNQFNLNFDRWFPFSSEEIEREEKRLLGYFRRAVDSPELAQGFHSAWIEKPYFPSSKDQGKNNFRLKGRNTRRNRKRPLGASLWIAIVSKSHKKEFLKILPPVMAEIERDIGHKYEIKMLETWLDVGD